MKIHVEYTPHHSHLRLTRDREMADAFKAALPPALAFLADPGTAERALRTSPTCLQEMRHGLEAIRKIALLPDAPIFLTPDALDAAYKLLSVAALWALRDPHGLGAELCVKALYAAAESVPARIEAIHALPPIEELCFETALFDERETYDFLLDQTDEPAPCLPLGRALRLRLFLERRAGEMHALRPLLDELHDLTEGLRRTLEVITGLRRDDPPDDAA